LCSFDIAVVAMALQQSTGSILGGASNAVDAAAMRAARLARLDGHSNIQPSNLVFSQEQPADGNLTAAPTNHATSPNPELVEANRQNALPAAATAFAQQSYVGGFESLPEGAFLRITAQLDLCSSGALVAAGGGTGETLPAALAALRGALGKAREDHRAAIATIEAERAADRAQHAGQANAMAQALAALAPLRAGRLATSLAARHGEQLQELFGALEQGANGPSEREPEFQRREEQAAAELLAFDAAARSYVAAGELHAITA
jgi:hypothetical protein